MPSYPADLAAVLRRIDLVELLLPPPMNDRQPHGFLQGIGYAQGKLRAGRPDDVGAQRTGPFGERVAEHASGAPAE
jgi:hypothetical protein